MRRPDAAVLAVAAILLTGFPVVAMMLGPPLLARASGGEYLRVPGTSMAPTLLPGDVVLAWPVGAAGPMRGDVVIYESRADRYLGRVVAFAGEQVRMQGGIPAIDGQPVTLKRIEDRVTAVPPGAAPRRCLEGSVREGRCTQERWRETLPGGTSHVVLNIRGVMGSRDAGAMADDTPALSVPAGHVFILGDHRDNAVDSRFVERGPVALDAVRAVVTRLHYSTAPGRRWAGILQGID